MRAAAALLVAAALAAGCAPAPAGTAPQVVGEVQRMLRETGFGEVDANTLSTSQVAAIYLQLQGRALEPAGLRGVEARQRVRAILARG